MIALLAVAATVALLAAGCGGSAHKEPATQSGDPSAQKSEKAVQYTCSMHPEVVQDKPGDCPKCGMKLVEKH
jgi:outer membrane biogenesis lipoprotein LolB